MNYCIKQCHALINLHHVFDIYLQFWVPTVNLNKFLVEYSWLTKLTHYIYYVIHTYIFFLFLYVYIFTYFLCFTTNLEKICTIIYRCIQYYSERSCLSFGYKGKENTATSEDILSKESRRDVQVFLFVIKNLVITWRYHLWKIN
jgi:hypothetical protein